MSLLSKVVLRLALVLILAAAVLFIPAGSWRFWQGWAFLSVTFIPSIVAYLYFYKNDPQLLERRLQSTEKVSEQKFLVRVMRPLFFVAFLIPGLDYRWGWSRTFFGGVPLWLTLLCQVLVLAGFLFVFWVMKVYSFASRTIQVEAGQKVISTGPFAMVR